MGNKVSPGLGAWYKHGPGALHTGYKKGDGAVVANPTLIDQMVAAACISIKKELAFNGYDDVVGILEPRLGIAADQAIRAFQTSIGHVADGNVGPLTAKALYSALAVMIENKYNIPGALLRKQILQESGSDPGAQGFFDGDDHGLIQINLFFHPGVTIEQASDGQFAMTFTAQALVSGFAGMLDWDGALAAYNIGTVRAALWVKAGKPAHLFVNGDHSQFDFGAAATDYVTKVHGQVV